MEGLSYYNNLVDLVLVDGGTRFLGCHQIITPVKGFKYSIITIN